MSDLLWQKPGVTVDAEIQAFLAGDDVILDREFFLHDIAASQAHAEGLQRIGIVSADELDGLARELAALADDFRSGAFVLDARYEDGHSAIEARLVERLGDAGRRIHTGRSRNDQILVATRLWLKDKLARVRALCSEIAGIALARAEAEGDLPMPGYTHLQRAVVSSAAMWWAGWAEAYIDNAVRAADTLAWIDANPLGTAAGYGVNLPLDREHTTQALGFARMQVSPLYAQLSRGKFELAALDALGSADARPAPPGLGPEPVHERRIRFRRAAGAIHDRQLDHAEQAQSGRDRTDARQLRQRRRGAHARSNSCCRCRRATTATCSSARARCSTGSARASARWRCCRTCCATSNGGRSACARRSNRRCTRPIWPSTWRGRACRSATPIVRRRTRRAGRRAILTASLAARTSPGAAGDARLDILRQRLRALD